MTKQAQVGAFTLVALLLLFGVFYLITDFGTRHTGYRIGVHFQSAAGLTTGAQVYFSGVDAGSVDQVQLLPDNTVDVILAMKNDIDVPAASKFLIQAPLTGNPALVIIPPRQPPPIALLPREVLPIAQQPRGTNGVSIGDLLAEGQGEIKRLNSLMALIEARTPKLLNTLQSTLDNANALTISTRSQLAAIGNTLQGSLGAASQNIVELSATLNGAATTDSKKVGVLLDQFNSTAVALNKSMTALESLASDPRLKQNVLSTTQNIAETTATLAALTKDLRTVTGDPQTQAQMRSTIANLDAVMQKANSLLGQLGGTSSVYGVDQNATPAPLTVPSTSPFPPYPGAVPTTQPEHTGVSPQMRANVQGKLASLARNLVAIQVRLSGLSPQHNPGLNPVMTSSQGPLGDINLLLLPHSTTNLMLGANSIGNNTTWNALLQQKKGDFEYGGGVLYSQIGLRGAYAPVHGFGLETRIYDLTYPMIDLYGNLHIAPGAELFFGQRDVTHASRRNTFGVQYQF
jgi:phospholipid/cholesterol/gamma-HCH transport system substrate-binding protein